MLAALTVPNKLDDTADSLIPAPEVTLGGSAIEKLPQTLAAFARTPGRTHDAARDPGTMSTWQTTIMRKLD